MPYITRIFHASTKLYQVSWMVGIIIPYAQLAHNKSPHMLFSSGMLILQHSRLCALDFFDHVDSEYGVDEDAPVPSDDSTSIEIPNQVTDANFILLQHTVDPLGPSDDYGVDIYEQTLALI